MSMLHNYYYNLAPAQVWTKKFPYLLDSRMRGNDNPGVLYSSVVMLLS